MRINSILLKNCIIPCLAGLGLLASCKSTQINTVEPAKDITGKWQVVKVVQNGLDISSFTDLSVFSINFNADNTYTLNGQIPFIVNTNGKWAFNDPQYPFSIAFTPDGGAEKGSKLQFPIVGASYQIGIEFANKCEGKYENTYQYSLKRVGQ